MATVIVRFVSSLTSEEEILFARTIIKAASGLLDLLPIAYSVRIERSDNRTVYEYSRPAEEMVAERVLDELLPDGNAPAN